MKLITAKNQNRRPQPGGLVSRRQLLRSGGLAIASLMLPTNALAEIFHPHPTGTIWIPGSASRALALHNLHTGESLNVVYFEKGKYLPDALHQIDYFFRDFRTNQMKSIDPRLLDLLRRIHLALATPQPFNLISGYRSPATNAWLASHTEGVSHHSMHVEGKAADINVPGRDLAAVQQAALALKAGGVGYYPHSNFVHVDTGRVRHW